MQQQTIKDETDRNSLSEAIIALVREATVEVTPGGAKKIDHFQDILPVGCPVYVTFLPGSDFNATLQVVERLKDEEMQPIPHIAARSLPNKAFLEDNLKKLSSDYGVCEALLIGGGVDKPVGDFTSSIEVLETELFEIYGFKRIGLAGHPEGSPDISDEGIQEALSQKNAYHQKTSLDFYLTTQFCFTADPVIRWAEKISAAGNQLPVRVGVPGLATVKTLLKHAQQCGIGPSMRVLTRQSGNIAALMRNHQPGILIRDLAQHKLDHPETSIQSIHWYPLGGLRKTMLWASEVMAGRFTLDDKSGIKVDLPE